MHEKVICSCGRTIRNCRCPGPLNPLTGKREKPIVVESNGCASCKAKAALPQIAENIYKNFPEIFSVPRKLPND